jgi:lipopolysaccharide cholinephosphotransferase
VARALDTEEIRSIQLSILDALHARCEEDGLRYMLAYGSLLGAMRHSGYIPWDDDIDVMMPRADYDRLCAISSLGPFRVWSQVSHSEWPLPYAKVADLSTRVVEESRDATPVGVNVDVFPIDGVPSGRVSRIVHRLTCRAFEGLRVLHSLTPRPGRFAAKSAALGVLQPVVRLIPASTLTGWRTAHATRWPESEQRAGVVVGSYPWSVPTAWLIHPGTAVFESRTCRVPARPHDVLECLYGDYTRLPPEDQRTSHHAMTAYRR